MYYYPEFDEEVRAFLPVQKWLQSISGAFTYGTVYTGFHNAVLN